MLTQKTLVATEQRASEVAKVTSERVIAVDDRLRLIAAILAARDGANAEVEDLARTVFHAVAQIEDAGHFTRVAGPNLIAPALRETVLTQLASDAAADLVTTTLDGKMRIMLARNTSMPAVNGVLMAELNPGFLWGEPVSYTDTRDVRVVARSNGSIVCPWALPDATAWRSKAA